MPRLETEELRHWLRLCLTPSIGDVAARKLLRAFGLPNAIFEQPKSAIGQVLNDAQAHALQQIPPHLEQALSSCVQWLEADASHHIVTLGDARYPSSLLELPDPPIMLYGKGHWDLISALNQQPVPPCIAIVGSRSPTPQGCENALEFAKTLSAHGFSIVSGMALGIDAQAHQGALHMNASTIAVVGTGLDRVYPKEHMELAQRIAQSGLVLGELPLGTAPIANNFPKRNRIIAALSLGTVVVEANLKSGSLITARLALEQGKEVFAIPGSIHAPQAKGCHALIKNGAKLVESAQDILDELKLSQIGLNTSKKTVYSTFTTKNLPNDNILKDNLPLKAPKNNTNNNKNIDFMGDSTQIYQPHTDILRALGHDPVSLDALVARTGFDAAQLQAKLLELELAGQAARLPGGLFQRRTCV